MFLRKCAKRLIIAHMKADFELDPDGSVFPAGRGGARLGAGRKPLDYEKPQVVKDFDAAKLRKELSLADMHELNYKVKSGEYVERAAVREASATLLALAQSLRGIPDNLERKFNLSPEIAQEIEKVINASLADLGESLAMFTTETA
jgi:phage terminase Nu1 subunit (DNA packaging protein)